MRRIIISRLSLGLIGFGRNLPLAMGLLFIVLLCPEKIHGAGIAVTANAAASGSFGAEVTVGSHCPGDESVTLAGPPDFINGSFSACGYLDVQDMTFVGLDNRLTAGVSVSLQEGFSVTEGTELTVSLSPSLSPFAFVTDTTPSAEVSYRASFQLRLDNLTLNGHQNNEIAHLVGRSNDGAAQFEVRLRRVLLPPTEENRLLLAAREDDGSVIKTALTEEYFLPDGYNRISVDWLADAGLGQLLVSINDAPFIGLSGLYNGAATIDRVNWGIVSGEASGAFGHLEMDEFSSSR